MKSGIVIAELRVNQPGENVFSRVLLHEIKALRPVHMSGDGCARLKLSADIAGQSMGDNIIFNLYIPYGNAV